MMRLQRGAAGSVQVPVVVHAESCGDEVEGWTDGALKVHVVASLENGLANAAVERLLAEMLGVARRQIAVVAGHASHDKVVEIAGLAEDEVDRALPGRLAPAPVGESSVHLAALPAI